MYQHLRRSRRTLLSPKAWKVRLVFWAGAVLVGLVCVAFALLAEQASGLFLTLAAHNPLLPLIITPLGIVLVAWLTLRFFPGAQGSGIPQAIASLEMHGKSRLLTFKIAFGKILLTLMGLMAGASVGRYAPSVQVGAAIMHSLGRFARFPPHYMGRGLILAGSAAGVAAAFNTPLAGVVFAIEEMSRSFEQKTSGIVLTAVIVAGITAMAVTGNYHYYGNYLGDITMDSSVWGAALACGLVGGLLGGLFSQGMIRGSQWLAPLALAKPLLVALLAGIAVALIGYLSGYSSSGTGFNEAKAIISGEWNFDPLYPLYKMGATLASYFSGIPGGIFAPSLATGAGIGADLGHWLPLAPVGVMVLLGMAGYFSGVVQTPITAFVIVMEVTGSQELLLPLMATSFVAYGTSLLICPKPLYHTLAEAFLGQDKRP